MPEERPLAFVRDTPKLDAVELYTVAPTVSGARVETIVSLSPDKAIELGLEMAHRGWRAKTRPAIVTSGRALPMISVEEARKYTRDPHLKPGDVVLTENGPKQIA